MNIIGHRFALAVAAAFLALGGRGDDFVGASRIDTGTKDALSLWNDNAPSRRALVEYVNAVTDEKSPDFIPPERRIAVFDLDGTLFCETDPTYFDWQMFEKRVLDDPTCRAPERLKTAARKSREGKVYPPLGNERERMTAEAYRGISLDELDSFIRRFMEEDEPGYPGMKRGDMF